MKKVTNTTNNPRPEWLFGLNPNAIEAQEKQGQTELVQSSQLPLKANVDYGEDNDAAIQYKKMGIQVGFTTKGDELFVDVKLPKGWKKQSTDHDMWSKLLDNKGRERAMIFYKAAFYDRSSHISFSRRYTVETIYMADRVCQVVVKDKEGDKVIFQTPPIYPVNGESAYKKQDEKREDCNTWLQNKYPNHRDINAYWD